MRLYAIGDVHGRLDLLSAMHRRIESGLEPQPTDWRVIHLGDYADRGPELQGRHRFPDRSAKRAIRAT